MGIADLTNEFIQVGYARQPSWGSTVWYFDEVGWNTGNPDPPNMLSAVPNPKSLTQDKYGVHQTPPPVEYGIYINTSLVDEVAIPNWPPEYSVWFGEQLSYTDQTPGDLANSVLFSSIAYQDGGGTWHSVSPAYNYGYNDSAYGSGYWGSGSSFDIYDSRYNSEG